MKKLVRLKKKQVVEVLRFNMDPSNIDEFLELENQIWTAYLEKQKGFIGKDVWIGETDPGEIRVLVYWNSTEEWKAVPVEELIDVDKKFKEHFGKPFNFEEEFDENHQIRIIKYRKRD